MKTITITLSALAALTFTVMAQDKNTDYSANVHEYPNQALFGDMHVHTSYSADAGMIGCTLGPEAAYRYARGEQVASSTGVPARLARPLDFLVVTDHAENLGLAPAIMESNSALLKSEFGKHAHDLVKAGKGLEAFDLWRKARATGKDPMAGNNELARDLWARTTKAAEKYNAPGVFTAMIGYEWTSVPGGNNLHRNVIFRDGKDKADQILPFSSYDSEDPEDLWQWMADYEKKTGGKLLAIPHNGNLSNGLMFDDVTFTTKTPLSRDYAEQRSRWEPVYEVTQMKGDGETHPVLSPKDEFADFENWDVGALNAPEAKTADMLPREYAREAFKRGLAYESTLGANPFKFGILGSTDTHTALSTTDEDSYFGKVTPLEPAASQERMSEIVAGRRPNPEGKDIKVYARQVSPAGLAGVWARENTREALWDALKRREVFATTGTRIKVRVFAGWKFDRSDLQRSNFAEHGYQNGVPMGGDLESPANGGVPTFLIRSLRDPEGANLDRLQVIKGWLDGEGKTHERIYDVAVSDGREIEADGRCKTPVGNTVDINTANYTNKIGDPALEVCWRDPEFDPRQRAFYYIRVLEIPTPRWTTYDAKVFKVERPEDVPATLQERAYTSPIWYNPEQ